MDFKSLLSQLDQLNEAKKAQVEEGRSDESDDDDYDAEAEAEKAEEKAEAKRKADREEIDEGIMDEPATKDTPTGRIHKAKPGGYGRKDDEDDEGKKVKADAPKRGRGRPKKGGDETGEVKKYDWSAFGAPKKDVKLPKWDKSKTTKHSLKDWVEHIEAKYIAEGEQITIKPASQVKQQPGQSSLVKPGQPQQVQGQPKKNTQVIQQGDKTLGTVDNPQLAQQIKQSIGKGELTLMPGEEQMAEAGEFRQNYTPEPAKKPGVLSKVAGVAKKVFDKVAPGDEELLAQLRKSAGVKTPVKEADIPTDQNDVGAGLGAGRSATTLEGKDEGKPGKNFAKIAKSAGEKYGSKAAGERVAGAVRAKLAKQGKLEEAKPDFLDLDKDGDKKESMKKAAKDKKAVKESAEHRLKAAHHRGKAHALAKENYNCKYDDMEEARMYHEGFKEGLDECYGQVAMDEGVLGGTLGAIGGALVGGPMGAIGGYSAGSKMGDDLGENSVVDDMASFGAHHDDEVEEGNAFTAALARTPAGGKFSVGGKTFTDRSGYDSKMDEAMNQGTYKQGDRVNYKGAKATVQGITTDENGEELAILRWDNAHAAPKTTFGNGPNTIPVHWLNPDNPQAQNFPKGIDEMAFESWDNQLNSLLTEGEKVDEGMTVSISKGQQGAPDSVSVSAQDQDADALLSLIKQAGLGLFGNDDQPQHSDSTPMSVAVDGEPAEVGADGAEIDVVDDHDGMMSLIKKMTGGAVGGSEDYADEEGHEEHEHEETCDACGSADCECDSEEEVVDEVQSEDQMEYQVAEDNPPDSGAEEVDAEDQEIAADNAAASPKGGANDEEIHEGGDGGEASEEDDEEQVTEWANDAGEKAKDFDQESFETDIDFITKVISGGLNKPKSTGQTTIPVIAGQSQRMGVSEDALVDWKKLAGL